MIRRWRWFSGQDGLDAIRVVVAEAARLLRPAGLLCVEHADVQGESAQQVVLDHGGFSGVRDHPDLAGRATIRHGPASYSVILSLRRLSADDSGRIDR